MKKIHQNYCFEQNENYITGVLLHGIHELKNLISPQIK